MDTIPRELFTIGWIAPLPLEFNAALASFDGTPRQYSANGYSYIGGQIGNHFVIMACQSMKGTSGAADLARRMSIAFTSIEFFLMVGIAGAVPQYSLSSHLRKIFLGDVVVSMPGPGHGGVSRYDSGAWKNGKLEALEHSNRPPERVISAVNTLKSFNIPKFPELLPSIEEKIKANGHSGYKEPPADEDILFPKEYPHQNVNKLCTECCNLGEAQTRESRKEERSSYNPAIHYGRVGSTDQLQMDPAFRDELYEEDSIIAFEMEVSGIINMHPSMAIRGISDYADTHRAKDSWQQYAAMTAAAYAKALVKDLPLSDAARKLLKSFQEREHENVVRVRRGYINNLVNAPPHFVQRPDLLEKIHGHIRVDCRVLHLYGITGCGKTFIARHFALSGNFTDKFQLPGKSEADFRTKLVNEARAIPGLVNDSDSTQEDDPETGVCEEVQTNEMKNFNAVIAWLNLETNGDWFILVDDVQFEEIGGIKEHWLSKFVTQVHQGTIVITSQCRDLSNTYRTVKVGALSRAESLKLMEDILGPADEKERAKRGRLARRLHNHALSVETAATYIEHYKIGIEEYSSRWESCDAEIFDNSGLEQFLAKSVTLAIAKLDLETQNFLFTCSFFDSGCVWSDLFPDLSVSEFNTYAAKLGKFSLIERVTKLENGDGGFTVHPAVHAIARITQLQRPNAEQIINLAINNVGFALSDEYEGAASEEQARILPHVKQCKENLLVLEKKEAPIAPENLPILGKLGAFLQRRGQLDDAEKFYNCALNAYEAQQPVRSSIKEPNEVQDRASKGGVFVYREPDYYLIVNNYGMIFKARGDLEKAMKCFDMVVQSVDISNQTDVLNLANVDPKINLALAFRQQGRLKEATNFLVKEKLLYGESLNDEGRIQIARINQYLGTIDKLQGLYTQAERKINDARATMDSILGSDSLDVAIANKELASICLLQDDNLEKLSKAEKYLNSAEIGIKKHCDPNSRLYLDLQWHQLMFRLITCRMPHYDSSTSTNEVCSDFDAFIERLEILFGRNDSATLHNTRTYGKWLCKIGNFDEGERRLMRAIDGYASENVYPMDQAFACKDLADQYSIHSGDFDDDDESETAGIEYLSRAREYYLKAEVLFHSVGSEYAQSFIDNIKEKLASIESSLGENQRQEIETGENHAPSQLRRNEDVYLRRPSMIGSEIHVSRKRSFNGTFRRIFDYIGTSKSRSDG